MCIVVKHTSQNIPKEQEQHYPLFYISWAWGGAYGMFQWLDMNYSGTKAGNGKWLVFAHVFDPCSHFLTGFPTPSLITCTSHLVNDEQLSHMFVRPC